MNASTTSKREKSVALTPRGIDYLAHQRGAARAIEDELRAELGEAAVAALESLLDVLDVEEAVRLRAYLRSFFGGLAEPEPPIGCRRCADRAEDIHPVMALRPILWMDQLDRSGVRRVSS